VAVREPAIVLGVFAISYALPSLGMMRIVVVLMNCKNDFRCINEGNVRVTGFPQKPIIPCGAPNSERWKIQEEAPRKYKIIDRPWIDPSVLLENKVAKTSFLVRQFVDGWVIELHISSCANHQETVAPGNDLLYGLHKIA
jgi:hypothetical protein